mmetsp:Transcript_20702/g.34264  ORF Transcript_20702/g.34264 Transcript_20702/m.34264 type:complete len:217 (+) Transcript_20702:132-782(+)
MDTTNSCQGVVLIIDIFRGSRLDVSRGHGINSGENLSWGHATSVGQQLSSNVFGNVGVSIESHQHGSLEVDLGTLNFLVGWSVDQSHEVVHDNPHKVIKLVVRSNTVDTEETSVLVASVEGRNRMGTFFGGNLLAHSGGNVLTHTRSTIVRSQHGLHQHEREGVLRSPRSTLESNGNVCHVHRIKTDSDITSSELSRVHNDINTSLRGGGQASKGI